MMAIRKPRYVALLTGISLIGICGYAPADTRKDDCDEYEKLAHKGVSIGQTGLAQCYLTGIGRELDFDEAEKWLVQAINGGSQTASVSFASLVLFKSRDEPKYEQAITYLREAVDHEDKTAAFALGVAYRNGIGVPADPKQANQFLRLAADRGHLAATFVLFGQIVVGETQSICGKGEDFWRGELRRHIGETGIYTVDVFRKKIVGDELFLKYLFSKSDLELIANRI